MGLSGYIRWIGGLFHYRQRRTQHRRVWGGELELLGRISREGDRGSLREWGNRALIGLTG